MYLFLSFCSFCLLIWIFRLGFCTHEGIWPYRSLAQMSCRKEVGVSFVVLGVWEPQIARHAIWRTRLEGHYSEGPFSELGPSSFVGILKLSPNITNQLYDFHTTISLISLYHSAWVVRPHLLLSMISPYALWASLSDSESTFRGEQSCHFMKPDVIINVET
jgi:hypothetical protein